MKFALFAGLLVWTLGASAQETNPILGNWTLNKEESTSPGQLPEMEVRQYREGPDGYITGLAIWVDAGGNPAFLQFTAKSDGNFYPEHNSAALSELQANGTESWLEYSEKFTDPNTIEWIDHSRGVITASGTKTFTDNGRKMVILLNIPVLNTDAAFSYTLVYDKQ